MDEEDLEETGREPGQKTSRSLPAHIPQWRGVGTDMWQGEAATHGLACCRRAAITWLWGLGQSFLSSLSFIRTALLFRIVVRIRGNTFWTEDEGALRALCICCSLTGKPLPGPVQLLHRVTSGVLVKREINSPLKKEVLKRESRLINGFLPVNKDYLGDK